jgi:hypothetical protein
MPTLSTVLTSVGDPILVHVHRPDGSWLTVKEQLAAQHGLPLASSPRTGNSAPSRSTRAGAR